MNTLTDSVLGTYSDLFLDFGQQVCQMKAQNILPGKRVQELFVRPPDQNSVPVGDDLKFSEWRRFVHQVR